MRPSLASVNRATAALIPSSEVPDINPTRTPDDILSLANWWWCVLGDPANDTTILYEQLLRLLARDPPLLHYDGELDALGGAIEKRRRLFARHAADLHHNALAAVDQLVVGGAQIDHQIAVGFAESDHRARGDGVEDELGRRTRFHPSRSCYNFGADDREQRHVDARDEI